MIPNPPKLDDNEPGLRYMHDTNPRPSRSAQVAYIEGSGHGSLKFVIALIVLALGLLLVSPKGCSLPNIPIVTPTYDDAWVVFIEETDERNKHPEMALLYQDWQWRQSLDERGIKVRFYDDDQPEAAGYKKYTPTLPAVVFIRPNGDVPKIAAVPKTDTKKQIENMIREVTGK